MSPRPRHRPPRLHLDRAARAALPSAPVVVALAWLALGGAARAQPAERAAVLVYPGRPAAPARAAGARPAAAPAPTTAAQVAGELRRALAERKIVVVEGAIDQGLRAHADRLTQPLLMRLGAVRELLRAGQRRLAEVELEQAAAALEEAERRCGDLLLLPEAPALLAEVLRWRGVTLFELKRRPEALLLFRRALVLAPGAGLTEAEVRPELALAFRRVAAELGPAAPAQIAPQLGEGALRAPAVLLAAAQVTVDGAEVPLPPQRGVAEAQLVPGEHVVVVRAPGFLPSVLRTELPPPGGQPLRVALAPDRTEAALAALRRAPGAAGLAALCQALSLGEVILGATARDGADEVIAAERFRCGAGVAGPPELSRTRAEAPAPLRARAEGLLARLLGAERPAPAPGGQAEPTLLALQPIASPRPPPPRRVPIYARPWLWVGAALVATGVLLGVALRPQPPAQATLVVDPRGFSLRF